MAMRKTRVPIVGNLIQFDVIETKGMEEDVQYTDDSFTAETEFIFRSQQWVELSMQEWGEVRVKLEQDRCI